MYLNLCLYPCECVCTCILIPFVPISDLIYPGKARTILTSYDDLLSRSSANSRLPKGNSSHKWIVKTLTSWLVPQLTLV